MNRTLLVAAAGPAGAESVVDVLCDAFEDYPVMRYVLGERPGYASRLRTLIGFFVAARYLRGDVVLCATEGGTHAVAVALVTLPGDRPPPEALTARREEVWQALGTDERARYEQFSAAAGQLSLPALHHHLNMIGVRASHRGRGCSRPLLEHVHRLAEADQGSAGVTLSTEVEANVRLYEHFGYRLLGHARVAPELETWALYRPREADGA